MVQRIKRYIVCLCAMVLASASFAQTRIFIAGASTICNYEESHRPQSGWGEHINDFLPDVQVFNHARAGRSTKSFITEGRWDKMISEVETGDLVLISFGHNDEKSKDPARYTEPYGEYSENLVRFVNDVRSKNAYPVLITPLSRRQFGKDGVLRRTHRQYPTAMRKIAAENGVPLVDLENMSYDWIQNLGDEQSKKFFMWVGDKKDDTHLNMEGARVVAGMIVPFLKDIMQDAQKVLSFGLHPQIMNVEARQLTSLDGQWKAIVDQYENGYYDYRLMPMPDTKSFFSNNSFSADKTKLVEFDFDTDMSLQVPGDWNTQSERLYYYEGTVWYRQKFNVTPVEGKRYFLYFGAVNYEAIVGLNGHVIAKHTGGYTPFNIEVTDKLLSGENTVIVKVDNKRHPEAVPTINSDWWNYGGITRSVCLVETPSTFVREYGLKLKKGSYDTLEGFVLLDGQESTLPVTVEVPALGVKQQLTPADGSASFEIKLGKKSRKALKLWSPESPVLYDVNVMVAGNVVRDRIGFRQIEARGNELFLNGNKIFCKGICVHEEKPLDAGGRSFNADHARQTLQWVKEMNGNFVRLAHYPHNEAMVKVAEEMGIMVWSEIPVYWTIHWENPTTYKNAEAQLVDMITRDRNRANVIIWSVANETPHSDARLAFLSRLIDKAHSMDDSRLVSAAMEKEYVDKEETHATVKDDLVSKADMISFNQYVGWYDGDVAKCDRVYWTFDVEKPVFISEWGGGALYGNHGPENERFTEEYMENLYRANTKMLDRIPGLCGSTPWLLKDFRSPRRQLKGIQDDYNRKGVISEFGQKKKSYFVLKDWYSTK